MKKAIQRVRDIVFEQFKEEGITKEHIEDVIKAQFGFVVKVMKEGKWERVRLQYLGTFLVTERKKKELIRRRNETKRKLSTEGSREDTPKEL